MTVISQKVSRDKITEILHLLPPELAHDLALGVLERFPSLVPVRPLPSLEGLGALHMNLRFKHPICLAAGFDKNGCATRGLARLGFSAVEVGSITERPQAGNPKPRLFRLSDVDGLINRMGFNSAGIEAVHRHLLERDRQLVIGANFGLNKGLKEHELQFRKLTAALARQVDYITINLSSPNTVGLRGLLEPSYLESIIVSLHEELHGLGLDLPIVVKISPDTDSQRQFELLSYLAKAPIRGVIVCNTTVDRDMLPRNLPHSYETGGLSGKPLATKATALLIKAASMLPSELTIIASGGISTGQDIYDRLSNGAHLVQIYTTLIYRGVNTVPRMIHELRQVMKANSVKSVNEIWESRSP